MDTTHSIAGKKQSSSKE